MTLHANEGPSLIALIGPAEVRGAVQTRAGLGAREKASGRLLRSLSELVDSHPGAAARYIDVGTKRASVRKGVRVCTVPRDRVTDVEQAARTIARAFCALESSPRAFVLSAASLLSLGQRCEAEAMALTGICLFGTKGEGAPLAMTAAMAARMRGDWVAARRHYLSMHDCRIDSYRRIAFAAASIAAVEWRDLSAARHFYVALMSLGVPAGHDMIQHVASTRRDRGEGAAVERALNQLHRFSLTKPNETSCMN